MYSVSTMSIQDFQMSLQTGQEKKLWELLQTITKQTTPEDIRSVEGKLDDPLAWYWS